MKFAGQRDVEVLHVIEQALGVPMKRFERPMLGCLTREWMLAIIGKPGPIWIPQRDHPLLYMLYSTRAQVSEIFGVRLAEGVLDGAACMHLHRKGRKQRTMPLSRSTVKTVRAWPRLNRALESTSALLNSWDGHPMTRANVTQRLALAVAVAAATPAMPSLRDHRNSPHTDRHTTAMHLLQSGERFEGSALWLGHESPTGTHPYTQANLAKQEKALAKRQDPAAAAKRFRATDSLLEFLKAL